ncbi:histone chaperone napB [Aspergillus affinis]|uniref:histone chaperone napB n=1 Tax=Aspergillus affinis TaxID=1070780 RepID=UPI0022FE96C8|nr:uncharacterized protein KD926_006515 [Aspergillus affinis]KAI9041791.1 hypothetical protein KD926_006515 [Aspergillus affinis]
MAENIEDLILPDIPKELAQQFNLIEQKFVRAEVDQIRNGVTRFRPILKERDEAIANSALKDSFWTQVFANAPPDVDEYVLESDAAVLGIALKSLSVERFEVDDQGNGEPRSFRLTLEFRPEDNESFENEKLVKEFYWRKQITRSPSGAKRSWEGLVSEPVRINWKEGQDLTKGLLDAACDLAEAEKKNKGDRKELPEFKKLQSKIEEAAEATNDEGKDADDDDFSLGALSPAGTSFFSLFGYRGRSVTAEESKAATKEDDERFQKLVKGEQVEEDDEEEDEDDDEDTDEAIEIFPDGDELAIALAEDLYTHAFKYFGGAADDDASELMDGEDDESEDEGEERPRKKTKV